MNLIILLAFVVSVFSIVAAESERKPSHCAFKKCTHVLEAIVFQPETYYREYLDRISEEIKYILWTTQACIQKLFQPGTTLEPPQLQI
jgi:hypothetical protein